MNYKKMLLALALVFVHTGCERESSPKPDHHAAAGSGAAVTNRVDINSTVRQNLGITFARVQSRNVARTLRLPGRFELKPTASREYRAAASGTVQLLVQQYQKVEVGTPLYLLDSPAWRGMQRELVSAHAAVTIATATNESTGPLLAAHENHHNALETVVALWAQRVASMEKLEGAGAVRLEEVAPVRSALATARAELAETLETEAELKAKRSEAAAKLEAAKAELTILFDSAASLAGLSVDELRKAADSAAGEPRWRMLSHIEVKAIDPGIVNTLSLVNGGLASQHGHIITTIQPTQLRFRAVALQSDLSRLASGQRATVVPAQGLFAEGATALTSASIDNTPDISSRGGGTSDQGSAPMDGVLTLAPTADPQHRTIDLLWTAPSYSASWAKAGVAGYLEVITSGAGMEELAIPLKCVTRDGTQAIIFRRDPANPDKAIRMEAELGIDDGRWVIIKSGVAEGNEIVLDGVYQLMVATSGSITKGGHFHPDGTFHEGED